jgi:RNA recognition motif. (a.k.a. RRM, RBD, or RNP domain)
VLFHPVSTMRRCYSSFVVVSMFTMTVAFHNVNSLSGWKSSDSPAISPTEVRTMHQVQHRRSLGPLHVVSDREPDIVEMMLGGARYEMVPLPDRMCDTTLFVGNLCEFVHDEDLSQLFQTVSALQSVPACVVRKANMQSLGYGFVSFLTVEEKEVSHSRQPFQLILFEIISNDSTCFCPQLYDLGCHSSISWK